MRWIKRCGIHLACKKCLKRSSAFISGPLGRAKCGVVATVVLSWLCSRIGGLRFGGIVFFPSPEGTTAASPGQTETSPSEFSCSPGLIRHPRFIGRVVQVAGKRRVAEVENSRGLPRLISASVSRRLYPSQSARSKIVIATYTPGSGQTR